MFPSLPDASFAYVSRVELPGLLGGTHIPDDGPSVREEREQVWSDRRLEQKAIVADRSRGGGLQLLGDLLKIDGLVLGRRDLYGRSPAVRR